MSLADLREDPLLARQMDGLDEIITGIAPLVIVHERDALLKLLKMFMTDTDRAASVAAFAVIELAKRRANDPYRGGE